MLKTIDPAGYERFVARQKEVAENYKKRKEATEENRDTPGSMAQSL